MKLKIDKESDALYLRLNEEAIVESKEIESGVILDYDAAGRVVGIELLNMSERVGAGGVKSLVVQTD